MLEKLNEILTLILAFFQVADAGLILFMAIYFSIGFFLSRLAKSTVFRLFWIILGLITIYTFHFVEIAFGLGMILPHLRFIFEAIAKIFNTVKTVTIDSYVLMLTIFFKIRKFFLWFYYLYKKAKAFFTKQDNVNEHDFREQEHTYQEDSGDYREHFKQSDFYKESARQRKERQEQEEYEADDSDDEYEEYIYEDEFGNEQIKREKKQSTSDSNEQFHSLEDELRADKRYKRFFSKSYYEVLGVSFEDDFKTIKRKYRKLALKYHPDQNFEEFEKHNILFAKINEAYAYFEKIDG